jgi:hypothetical protein
VSDVRLIGGQEPSSGAKKIECAIVQVDGYG